MSQDTGKTAATLILFLLLTLIVLSIESCLDSSQRRKAAEQEYRNQQLQGTKR